MLGQTFCYFAVVLECSHSDWLLRCCNKRGVRLSYSDWGRYRNNPWRPIYLGSPLNPAFSFSHLRAVDSSHSFPPVEYFVCLAFHFQTLHHSHWWRQDCLDQHARWSHWSVGTRNLCWIHNRRSSWEIFRLLRLLWRDPYGERALRWWVCFNISCLALSWFTMSICSSRVKLGSYVWCIWEIDVLARACCNSDIVTSSSEKEIKIVFLLCSVYIL